MPIKENKITITEIPNLNRLDRFNEFLIQIKIEAMMPEIKLLKHDGLETDDSASSTLVYYVTPFKRYKILEITGASINIFPPSTRLVPLYFRELDNVYYLTNVVENLIPYDSELYISSFGCAVNLSRHWAPYNHFFKDVTSLIPLCHYKLIEGELDLVSLAVKNKDVTLDETLDVIHRQYDWMFSNNSHVFIFITGGYDSRANLALAKHYADKYENEVTLVRCNFIYQNLGSDEESQDHDISKFLAEECGYDLLNFQVDHMVLNDFKRLLYTDERFIKMNPTITRPDTAFYYLVFSYIKNNYKDSLIIANQTDVHKGTGYDLIQSIKEDYHLLGVASERYFKYITNFFRMPYQVGFQNEYIHNVLKRSDVFDLYGQIDYFHYETYNSQIGPARSIWLNIFDIPFPFLDEEFLEDIFNLAPEFKKDAFIPKELVRRFTPALSAYEYISGSSKMYRKRKKTSEFVIKVFTKIRMGGENYFFKEKIYKKDAKNISVYATQLTAIKLAYIERKLKVKIVFKSK